MSTQRGLLLYEAAGVHLQLGFREVVRQALQGEGQALRDAQEADV